ncbi:lipopolysaccharide biosynthesis protein [Marinobacter sp. V034]|uniref:lipopolysaccharide biosynthesis protein n=1 Tax=Marinobacter sp. V034 TaxID=3459610 RepID=UPI0040441330
MTARLLNFGLRGLTLGIKFIFILSLAVFLPPETVGLYGLVAVTVAYSIYFVGIEFYTFSTRDIVARPKSEWSGLLMSQAFFFVLMYVLVLPAFSVFFWLEMLPWEIFVYFLLLVVLEHLSTELTRLLVVIGRPLLATVVIFTKQALWAVLFTFSMWLDPELRNINALMVFWMLGASVATAIGVVPLLRLNWSGVLKRIDLKWLRHGILVAVPLLISSVAVKSLFTFDRYAFEGLNNLALLGAYSVYMGVASAMLSFMESGVFVFYYPKMMKSYKQNNFEEFERAYQDLRKQSVLWLSILVLGASTAGVVIFPYIDEPVYAENIMLFLTIIVAVALFIVGYVFQFGLYATARDRDIVTANLTGLVSAGVSLFLLAQHSSYWAVTASMIVGSVVASGLKYCKWMNVRRELQLESQSVT